jgi:acetate kinase
MEGSLIMRDAILAMNAGSSSVKFAVFDALTLEELARGQASHLGRAARGEISGALGPAMAGQPLASDADHRRAIAWILDSVRRSHELRLIGAGHRVVHGGMNFAEPVRIDAKTIDALRKLVPLAPAHQPHNLAGIEAVAALFPGLPQVACFDTAFHRTAPRLAQLYPLPRRLMAEGLIRYGFHGLSYEHIARILPSCCGARATGKVIVAHLGNGASMCAMRNLSSIATTMGFTALDGLMMATRCGSVDPGLILHLVEQRGFSTAAVAQLLEEQSGLLGVSDESGDVRDLLASARPEAFEALALFAYRAVREAGSLIAALGGLDVLVFTGGIGEHAPTVRAAIGEGLAWCGVTIDADRNAQASGRINADASRVEVLILTANEERPIANAVREFVISGNQSPN